MNIDQINKVLSDLWPGWHVDEELGEGSYGTVYKARFDDPDAPAFAAIKVIPVPGNESEIDAFLAEGNNEMTARIYFRDIAAGCLDEARLMEGLKDAANVVHIQASAIVPRTAGIGWDVYIRMELLTPFTFWQAEHQPFPSEEIFRLGIDICRALSACAGIHILHRDIKPENIFVADDGCFKLGDFGVARRLSGAGSVLSQKGTYNYMAPEVYKAEKYTETADIYSLGLVLYRLANRNRAPFLPTDKQIISYSERVDALERRIKGETLPPPADAGPALAAVIARACRFVPEERYPSAEIMARDLEAAFDAMKKGAKAEERFAGKAALAPLNRRTAFSKYSVRIIAAVFGTFTLVIIAFLILRQSPALPPASAHTTFETSGIADHVIDWRDDALKTAMQELLEKDGDILLSDVWSLSALSLRDRGIRDISSLAELTGLTYLDLSGNAIEDASSLSALTGLEHLDISGNPIADISFVSVMNGLQDLTLTGCRITDIEPLCGLNGLTALYLADNPVRSFDSLALLKDLSILDISGTGFTDCSLVSGLPLTELYADNNRLTGIEEIAEISALTQLSLTKTGLSDVNFLADLTKLTWLELEENSIEDISPLSGLSGLVQCSLTGNNIGDIRPLSALGNLEYLDLRRNRLTADDLPALSGLSKLYYLDLSGNSLEGNIDALSGLSSLTWLSIRDNAITDISALKDMSLTSFYWSGNPIEDLSVLDTLNLADHD